jgi:Cu+-exporting ATPase
MYNIALVPVAAIGLLYPALAGIAMAATGNWNRASSFTLKRWKPKQNLIQDADHIKNIWIYSNT